MTAGTAVNPLEVARYVAARHRTNGDEAQQLAYIAAAAWRERYGHRHYRRPFSVACAAAFRETALALRRQAAVVDISEGVATGRVKGDVDGVFDRESLFHGDHHGQKTRDGYAEAAGGGRPGGDHPDGAAGQVGPGPPEEADRARDRDAGGRPGAQADAGGADEGHKPPGCSAACRCSIGWTTIATGSRSASRLTSPAPSRSACAGERARIARTARLLAELDDNAKKLIDVADAAEGAAAAGRGPLGEGRSDLGAQHPPALHPRRGRGPRGGPHPHHAGQAEPSARVFRGMAKPRKKPKKPARTETKRGRGNPRGRAADP